MHIYAPHFLKCMSFHFESGVFPRSLIQQGRPRFPWQWTPCLPETPVKLPPARCCKVTWGPSNDCHRGTASQCLGNLPKTNYSMEHNMPMALQFYSSKRCLLPAHPVSSCPLHQCLFFCILGMREFVRFVNFQSETVAFQPFHSTKLTMFLRTVFLWTQDVFSTHCWCALLQCSNLYQLEPENHFGIYNHMPNMGQSSGTLPSSKPQKFLLVC